MECIIIFKNERKRMQLTETKIEMRFNTIQSASIKINGFDDDGNWLYDRFDKEDIFDVEVKMKGKKLIIRDMNIMRIRPLLTGNHSMVEAFAVSHDYKFEDDVWSVS